MGKIIGPRLDLIRLEKVCPGSQLRLRPRMLVVPFGLRMTILLFRKGSFTITGIRNHDWEVVVENAWMELRVKLWRLFGCNVQHTLVNRRVKTILMKGHTSVRIRQDQCMQLEGVVTGMEELRNSILIRRAGVTCSIFVGSGAVIVFGRSISHMESIYRTVMNELLNQERG